MTSRKFHAQQQKKITYKTFEITHPAIGVLRYVGGQFYPKTLTLKSGLQVVFEPIQMKVSLPNMSEYGTLSMKIDIGRVGSQLKEKLRLIDDYNIATPNTETTPFIYREFVDGVETIAFDMWVRDFVIDGQIVAIVASDDNPSAINVAKTYKVESFPGLAVLS